MVAIAVRSEPHLYHVVSLGKAHHPTYPLHGCTIDSSTYYAYSAGDFKAGLHKKIVLKRKILA